MRCFCKQWLLFFCVACSLSLPAQEHRFRFFPISGLAPESDVLIGQMKNHFFFYNPSHTNLLRLQVYDTVTQSTVNRDYPYYGKLLSIRIFETTIQFVFAGPEITGTNYTFLDLDENGNKVQEKKGKMPSLSGPVKLVSSPDKQYTLFYEIAKKSSDSSQFRGVLTDKKQVVVKTLQYGFKQNEDLDGLPETILDNNGNTHILVYDKYSNYRISSDLTVNTIPLQEEQIISETFNFEKVKLKTLQVFLNRECNCLQAEGMYVDGITRINKGLYSIALPLGRQNKLAQRFIPFPDEMIRNFKKGFSATEESVIQSVQLEEMVYAEDGSFAVLRLSNGIPQKLQHLGAEEDQSLKSFSKALSTSRSADFQPPPTVISTAGVSTQNQQRVRTMPMPADKYANAPAAIAGSPARQSPLSSRSTGRNAPKFICVKLAKEQGIQWYNSCSLDVFATGDELYNRVFFVTGEKETMPVVLYQADSKDDPYPVLMNMKPGKPSFQKFPEKKLVFSPVRFLSPLQYASLYFNMETGMGGLLLIQAEK